MDINELERVSKQVIEVTEGIKAAKESETKLKKTKEFLTTQVLPSLLEGLGKRTDLESGVTLSKGMKYKGYLPSIGSDIRDSALDYFIDKGYGADLDGKLILEFDGDERDEVVRLLKFLIDISKDSDYLNSHDVVDLSPLLRSFYMAESVHYARLNSRLGDLYESQDDFDPQLFGFNAVETVNVKKGK